MSYLFSAYAVVWIFLFAYVMSIASRQAKLDRELETLKKILEQKK